jgi:MinD-like ATPase involved in chromosome partitioning or flagellar assembly
MLDALSLKDTKIGLETLGLMGCNLDDVVLVLNRADTSVGIALGDVDRLLNRAPDVLVPSDRAIPRAITDGVPIVVADPRSGAAGAFTGLAAIYAERAGVAVPGTAGRRGRASSRRSLLRKGR